MAKRRGRNRQAGPREPSGRLSRKASDRTIDENAAELAKFRRARLICDKLLPDSRLGTTMGRMFLLSDPIALTTAEYAAGERLARIVRDYDATIIQMRRHVAAANYDGPKGKSLSGEPMQQEIDRIRQAHTNALLAISAVATTEHPPKALIDSAVGLATEPHGFGVLEFTRAKRALGALAAEWKLDAVPEQRIRRAGEKLRFEAEDRIRAFDVVRPGDSPVPVPGDA